MQFLKRRFAHAPEGTAALFFIQIFATLGFAVLYSTLVLYATKHLHLGVKAATTLMGVFGAFSVAGHFQATESYSKLFIFATVGNFVAIVLAALTWRTLADRNTPLLDKTPKQFRLRQLVGIGILIGLVPVVWLMLQQPGMTETVIKAICAAVALFLIYITVRHSDRREQRNMTAYLILTIGSLMFWSLYQMAPSGLMLFAVNNVNLMVGPVKIQPQWIQNINTVCIVL